MSKYAPLWEHIAAANQERLLLTFDDIAKLAGFPVDHSFLTFKKELNAYGYRVGKISMKAHTIEFLQGANSITP